MKLYVIRHAEAVSAMSERKLTEKGERQSIELGRYFLENGLVPEVVLTSPVLRARQTAEILSSVAGFGEPLIEGWLSCGMSPEKARRELQAYAALNSVVLVGHEPDLSYLIQDVLGECKHAVKKASLTIIAQYLEPGHSPKQSEYLRF